MGQNNYFRNLSVTIMGVLFVLTAVTVIAAVFFSVEFYRAVFFIIAILLVLFLLFLLAGFIIISRSSGKNEATTYRPGFSGSLLTPVAFRFFMPVLLFASDVFNYRKEEIRRVYIKANNDYVLSLGKKVPPEKLLVILPHCLQWSECGYRMREGLNECRQCNRCSLGKIKELAKKHGVMVTLATGGTSARKAVRDLKPGLVVAVACERDLSSGIMDVRGLPVYGIINERPNGPCRDTLVDAGELEKVLRYFITERN
ncbi:MAG: DUF116 domain-containing protein [Clostridiaceae bacterium]|nr:DUF116 domain-containing protein [Clostridiaceae bacterium]